MLKTEKGSPDGIKINEYKAGEKYDLPESLYKVFIKIGSCEDASVMKKMAEKPQNKMMEIPDNKSFEDDNQEDIQETNVRKRRRS